MVRRSRRVSLILFLVVIAVAGVLYLRQRPTTSSTVVIERQVKGSSIGVSPAPEFLLRHAQELSLSSQQQEQIQQQATAYRKDIAPTQAQLTTATERYRAYLKQHTAKGTTSQELDRQSTEIQRLSAVIATTRHSYWEQAQKVLTPLQQQKTQQLVQRATLQDLM